MFRCILGHDRIHKESPLGIGGHCIDHCARCQKIIGVWTYYQKHWRYASY